MPEALTVVSSVVPRKVALEIFEGFFHVQKALRILGSSLYGAPACLLIFT